MPWISFTAALDKYFESQPLKEDGKVSASSEIAAELTAIKLDLNRLFTQLNTIAQRGEHIDIKSIPVVPKKKEETSSTVVTPKATQIPSVTNTSIKQVKAIDLKSLTNF